MPHYGELLLWGVGALLVYGVFSSLYSAFTRSRRARQLGCGLPVAVAQPFWDPLGIVEIRKMVAANTNRTLGDWFTERHVRLSKAAGYDVKTASTSVLGNKFMFTEDPKNIQAILATQFKDFSLGAHRRGNFFPLLGNGIFTYDGQGWEHSRAMLRPSFAKERVSNLELEERHNSHLLEAIPCHESSWSDPVDLQTLFFRLTIDTSTEFLFGESVDSQRREMKGDSDDRAATRESNFADAFDDAQTFLASRGRLGPRYWLIQSKKFREDCNKCHAFIDQYVHKALASTSSQSGHEKMLEKQEKSKYIFLNELVQQTRDPIEIRSQLLHILLAGRDTTASLLGWLFALLARNPAIFTKLRQAILSDFGTEATAETISFATLKNCKYLQFCLNEALRLYPVVPLNARMSTCETTLPRGGGPNGDKPVYVPKGQPIGYSVFAMHRNKELWGAEADAFMPERWEDRRHGFEYLPFNAGPRICLGQNFALTSAGFATVNLLQKFDAIEDLSGGADLKQNITLTMRPDAGVKVRLHRAA